MRKVLQVLVAVSTVVGLVLSILTLPTVPQGIAGWGKWLKWVDDDVARWLLPAGGWVTLAMGFCTLFWLRWKDKANTGFPARTPVADAESSGESQKQKVPTSFPPVVRTKAQDVPLPESLKGALEEERRQGAQLLAALREPLRGAMIYGQSVGESHVKSWEENVRHLLRDEPDLRALFDYAPLSPLGNFGQALYESLSGQARMRRVTYRLGQLDKVIEKL